MRKPDRTLRANGAEDAIKQITNLLILRGAKFALIHIPMRGFRQWAKGAGTPKAKELVYEMKAEGLTMVIRPDWKLASDWRIEADR